MNQDQENTLARVFNVARFFTRNAERFAGVGALVVAVAAYVLRVAKLPNPPEAETDATTSGTAREGAKQAKDTARTALAAPTTAMLNALRLHFQAQYATTQDVKDQQRAAEMTLKRPADLKRAMPTGQLQRLLGRALDLLATLAPDALKASYNHDAAKVARFTLLATQYGAVRNAPREARDDAKTEGETFDQDLDDARDFIKSDLLPAVMLLADDDADFVKAFKQANKQDDRRGGQSPKTPKPPTT